MAMTARELVFFIRAENQASGVFRKVARDIRGLPSTKAINVGQQYAADTQRMVSGQTALAKASNLNLTAGTKNLALRRAELAAQSRQMAVAREYNAIQQRRRVVETSLSRAQVTAERLTNNVTWRNPLPNHTMAQTYVVQQAALESVATYNRELEELAAKEDEVRLAADRTKLALDEQASTSSAAKINSIATAFSRVGHFAQIAGVIGAATLAGLAIHAAKFQTQTTLAATQVRPAGAPASVTVGLSARLNTQILKQMKEFPASSQEMADSFYQIFSGTKIQSIPKATAMLRTFNQMAVAGGTDLKSMTDAGISIFNNFPKEFKNMTGAANVFFSAVRYGRMTAQQFAGALGYIIPLAKDAGSTFHNIAADMAFFTRQTGGRLTRQDAQGYARLVQLLGRQDTTAGLAAKGIDVWDKATGKMRPVVTILGEIHDKLHLTPQETVNFFKTITALGSGKSGTQGTIQAIRIFSQGIQNIGAYRNVVHDVNKDQHEFTRSFEAMAKSPGVRWAVTVNNLKALAIVIGQQAIPMLLKIGDRIQRVSKWFSGLSGSTKRLIGEVAIFGAAGLILGGTLIRIGAAFTKLMAVLGFFTGRRGLGAVAGEAGSARLGVLGLLGVLSLFAVALAKDPHLIHQITSALGGTANALRILSIAMATFSIAGLIKKFTILGASASTATGAVSRLTASLTALRLLGPIAVVVTVLIYRKQIGDAVSTGVNKVDSLLNKIPGVNFSPSLSDSQFGALTAAKKTVEEAKKLGIDVPMPKIKLHGSLQDKAKEIIAYAKAVQKKAQAAIDRMPKKPVPTGETPPKRLDTRLEELNAAKARKVAKVASVARQQGYMEELAQVGRLDAALQKHHTLANQIAFDKAKAKIDKDYADQGYQDYTTYYLNKIESADKKATSNAVREAKKKVAAMKQVWTQAAQSLQQTYSSMQQVNEGAFGTIFQGPFSQSPRMQNELAWGGKMTGKDLLHDLRSQVAQFRHWRTALNKLQKAGIPFELLQQIEAAGPAALPQVQALLGLSKRDMRTYFRTFTKGRGLIETATQTDMSRQLDHYRSFGSKIALAIIQGLRDEKVPMLSYFEKLIKDMFPGLVKAAKGAPKDIHHGSVGSNPKLKRQPGPKKPSTGRKSPVIETTAARTQDGGNTYIENNYITTTADPASVKEQLKQARFKRRAQTLLV